MHHRNDASYANATEQYAGSVKEMQGAHADNWMAWKVDLDEDLKKPASELAKAKADVRNACLQFGQRLVALEDREAGRDHVLGYINARVSEAAATSATFDFETTGGKSTTWAISQAEHFFVMMAYAMIQRIVCASLWIVRYFQSS